jgi:FkbM family methyltransferase
MLRPGAQKAIKKTIERLHGSLWALTLILVMKKLIKRLFRSVGYDVGKFLPSSSMETLVAHVARSRNIQIIFDVGANTGQFARHMRLEGFDGRILSIEPLAAAHAELTGAAADDPNWLVLDRMAMGSAEGEIEINRSRNLVSSSILPIRPEHTRSAPDAAYETTETVPIRRLDGVIPEWLKRPEESVLLKMDVQGYEDRVLDGAEGVLDRIVGIQTELSVLPLYEGQLLYQAMLDRLQSMGFELFALWGGHVDKTSGRMLQFDVLMMRPE